MPIRTVKCVLTNFSPMFSHIMGNWWLFNQTCADYDLWQDFPWKPLKTLELEKPMWVHRNRTIAFWWPIGIPWVAPSSRHWVRALALANFLFVLWFGLRIRRLLRNPEEETVAK